MTKNIRILFIICFSFYNCTQSELAMDKKNDISEYGFVGKVKSVHSELFNLIPEKDTFRIGEKINGVSFDKNLSLKFNQSGNLVSSKEFLANGILSHEIIFIYDKNGRLIKRKEMDYYGKGSFYNYEFMYNSQDSITQMIFSNDDFRRVHKIGRDEKNRPIKGLVIENDTIFSKYIVAYNDDSQIRTEQEYKYDSIPVKFIDRTFNENNLKEKEQVKEFKAWDTLEYVNRFFYDEKGNLILEKHHIENDTTFWEIKNSYYKSGKLKETTSTSKGSDFFVITTRKYNKNGDLIEHSIKPSDNRRKEVWNYKLKYDQKNNWIEKVEYKDNQPLRITKRNIDYYD